MGIDPTPFWANLSLQFFESEHIQNLISKKSTRAYKYHTTSRFIDEIYAINNYDKFPKSFKFIYPGRLQLKLEDSRTHAIFLDISI